MDVDEPAPALKGVRRALEVLEYVAVHPGRAVDIADGLGLSWATLHWTLSQLEHGGLLQRDADSNRYGIGPRMWLVGTAYLANHPVLEVARSCLEMAAANRDIAVQLVERSDRYAVTLYSHQSAKEIITKADYGHHFPLHCGSKGQVLLAYSSPGFIDTYLATELEILTPETMTNPANLRERLAAIRSQGYARTEGDVQPFTGSIAAPVYDRRERVVAAVSFIARKSVFRDAVKAERQLESLLTTPQSISMSLGWRPTSAAEGLR